MEGYLCHAAAWFLLGILFAKVFCIPIDESDRKVSKRKEERKRVREIWVYEAKGRCFHLAQCTAIAKSTTRKSYRSCCLCLPDGVQVGK